VDLELAKAEADKVEDDEELRKKLWLKVAKHVIEQEKGVKRENIKKAIEFLSETNNLLKIEDILPFFPDFVLIDDFKVRLRKFLKFLALFKILSLFFSSFSGLRFMSLVCNLCSMFVFYNYGTA
jgi:hypothetical protein